MKNHLLKSHKQHCRLCPRVCGVNRDAGETGFCQAGKEIIIAETGIYPESEEKILNQGKTIGQVFFAHCNLRCVFCCNYGISIYGFGSPMTTECLATEIQRLAEDGAETIFYVTPEPYLPWLVEALDSCKQQGVKSHSIYVSSGYVNPEIMDILIEIFDSFVISLKPISTEDSQVYVGSGDYRIAVEKMLKIIAGQHQRCLLPACVIRLLVLPGKLSLMKQQLDFLADTVPFSTPINILHTFYPRHNWDQIGEWRGITQEEWETVVEYARQIGFHEFVQ